MIRVVSILFFLALLSACASNNPPEDQAEMITRVGVITGKEVVELEGSGGDSRVSTGVSASVSSGGGLSIGIGFLLSPLFNKSPDKAPVRYHVELLNGDPLTVYHDSDVFEVGDCVEISSLADNDKAAPLMKRIEGGC
jgi:hypothetical protein